MLSIQERAKQDADVRPVMVDDGDQVEQGVICDAVRCSVRPTGHQDHVLLKISILSSGLIKWKWHTLEGGWGTAVVPRRV